MANNSDRCLNCKHLNIVNEDMVKVPDGTCKAFPDGIPFNIMSGEVDHHLPVDGDNGIQYERREKVKRPISDLFKDVM